MNKVSKKLLLLVDKNKYWREKSAKFLRNFGAKVIVSGEYKYCHKKFVEDSAIPDLVILGCSTIRKDETEFINELVENKLHVIVLSSFLKWTDLRPLFLSGVDDVVNKPFDSNNLFNIVNETFIGYLPRDSFDEKRRSRI
jgi:response regulator RpfG family c-di-GMP phosphodiesterase